MVRTFLSILVGAAAAAIYVNLIYHQKIRRKRHKNPPPTPQQGEDYGQRIEQAARRYPSLHQVYFESKLHTPQAIPTAA